jgi:WD40 repeat protein
MDMEREINDNWDAVDWVYKHLSDIILGGDKQKLKTAIEEYKNISKLCRPYFLEKYLTYEAYSQGDSEMISLRKELVGILGSPNLKHNGAVYCSAVSPDGRYIISGSYDHTLKLWDLETGKEVRTFRGHSNWVTSVDFSPQGNVILSGSEDSTLKLWDMETGQCIKTIPLLWKSMEIKPAPHQPGLFAAANANGTVTLFDFSEIIENKV